MMFCVCMLHLTYLLLWFDFWLRGVDMALYGADNP
jgi:hypothetical protein